MFSLLLPIIFLAFISLGLPDSLLGSAWPVMHTELDAPLSYMGILSMLIACGTILSSLLTDRLVKRLGTGLLSVISIALTSAAMLGFALSDSFLFLCLWAVPYGLGAGAIDASLNNYVSLHYSAKCMNFLHCFWGVGTVISPYIMGFVLSSENGWHKGYFIVGIIQAVIAVIVALSLPLWKKSLSDSDEEHISIFSKKELVRTRGVPFMLVSFFAYCSLEATAGAWASSYLCEFRNVSEQTAAFSASLFYMGITAGRIISGFTADRFGSRRLIRTGLTALALGIFMVMLPVNTNLPASIGLFVIGLGCAPVYPALMNLTPVYFGRDKSLAVVGLQLASSYIGINLMPTLFGFLTQHLYSGLYPFYLFILAALLISMTELLHRSVKTADA